MHTSHLRPNNMHQLVSSNSAVCKLSQWESQSDQSINQEFKSHLIEANTL